MQRNYFLLACLMLVGCRPQPNPYAAEWQKLDESMRQADTQRTYVTTAELPNQDAVVGGLAYRVSARWHDDGVRVVFMIENDGPGPVIVPLPVLLDPQGRVYAASGDPKTLLRLAYELTGEEQLNPRQAIYAESFFPIPPTAGCRVLVGGAGSATGELKIPNPLVNGVEVAPVSPLAPLTQRSSSHD
jgi:hypothetical protein